MTIMQLIGTPVGAAAVSWMYPLLRDTYGIVGENAGLSSPISRRLAGFAEDPVAGLRCAAARSRAGAPHRRRAWHPLYRAGEPQHQVGAFADRNCHRMLVPASVIIVMFCGSVVDVIWRRVNRASNEAYMVPLASGLIAGEAIVAVVIPLLVALGVISQ